MSFAGDRRGRQARKSSALLRQLRSWAQRELGIKGILADGAKFVRLLHLLCGDVLRGFVLVLGNRLALMPLRHGLPKVLVRERLARANTAPRLLQECLKAGQTCQQQSLQIIIVQRGNQNYSQNSGTVNRHAERVARRRATNKDGMDRVHRMSRPPRLLRQVDVRAVDLAGGVGMA